MRHVRCKGPAVGIAPYFICFSSATKRPSFAGCSEGSEPSWERKVKNPKKTSSCCKDVHTPSSSWVVLFHPSF
jgi:hypothetical protein